jgi:hypothetical protein
LRVLSGEGQEIQRLGVVRGMGKQKEDLDQALGALLEKPVGVVGSEIIREEEDLPLIVVLVPPLFDQWEEHFCPPQLE